MAYENKDILVYKIWGQLYIVKWKKKTGAVLGFEVVLTYWDSDSF